MPQIPIEFLLFGATLLGVMFFHHRNLQVALMGLAAVVGYKALIARDVDLLAHAHHELPLLVNLFGLLVGFELLADHFRESKLALKLPAVLPNHWMGAFILLFMVWVMSGFLDNIAAAMIGASIATVVFQGHVKVGYLAAIVAASNAGGAGSVIGDTTTTMMWIDGVSPIDVLHAYLPAFVALLVVGIPISITQDRFHRITKDAVEDVRVDWTRVGIVAFILVGAIAANVLLDFPAAGVWAALLASAGLRTPHWSHAPKAARGACFLLALVVSASLMPVTALPTASPLTTFGLGFLSSVFDNIPLTKLALDQGGYDWGYLAFAVGFGGSMMWFGSSAGVAVSNDHPRLKNTKVFLKEGYWVVLAYVVAFAAMHFILGWQPHEPHK